jgi:hypothetical protein
MNPIHCQYTVYIWHASLAVDSYSSTQPGGPMKSRADAPCGVADAVDTLGLASSRIVPRE